MVQDTPDNDHTWLDPLLSEEGISVHDIRLVMEQCGVSRQRAVQALRSMKNDLVNAIIICIVEA